MVDRESLLAGIKAAPDDDTARLVYADWLQEAGDCDRDRATEDFIRRTCEGAHGKRDKVLRVADGKWLSTWKPRPVGGIGDFNFARLIPTLAVWIDGLNARAIADQNDPRRFPYFEWERKGRWLTLKYHDRPIWMPMVTRIEFWRGFVRRVSFRWPSMVDAILSRLLPDQPLCEPEMESVLNTSRWRNNSRRVICYKPQLGEEAWVKLAPLKQPWRPDRLFPAVNGTSSCQWDKNPDWANGEDIGTPQKRARWAVCMAMRAAAEDVIAGRREEQSINFLTSAEMIQQEATF